MERTTDPSDARSLKDYAVICEGFGTIKWKSYLRDELHLAWDHDRKVWFMGALDAMAASYLRDEIVQKTERQGVTPFSVYVECGTELGHSIKIEKARKDFTWNAVAKRAKEFLAEGLQKNTITRQEEIGYLGAIAVIEDGKSRPADKKGAIDLILRLEGVFDARNKGLEEGDEAQGTKELIEKLQIGSDGSS